jgi:NAD(P)-dependent dehydrogenase (short-subunit alcohol dehydrogenase family)
MHKRVISVEVEKMEDTKAARKKNAFVTGASQGLGAAIALALARDGFDVAVSARSTERLAQTVAEISAVGVRAFPASLDLTSQSSMEQAMAEVAGAFGGLDVLVNNAAVTLRKPALEVTVTEWDAVMGVNLAGTFFMCQRMGRHLIRHGRQGCIINLASTHGMVGYKQRSTYGISKAAVIHMTRMLAIEWAEYGVRVNAVAPGTVDTPSRAAFFSADPNAREAMLGRIPLRRFGTTGEVAAAVCYLASPEAAYITGQTLILDGGLTAY